MKKLDIKLVDNAKKRPDEYEELYKKYSTDVFNYIWYRVGHDRDIAEDLMQEVFVRAFAKLKKFQNKGYSYRTYLLTIAKNVLVNYFKKKKPIVGLDDYQDIPAEITQDQELDRKLEAGNLWKAVQDLSHNERDVILMHYKNDMRTKDIGTVIGKTPNAVKIILSRGRKKLKKHPHLKDMIYYSNTPHKYTKPRFLNKKNETILYLSCLI